MKNLLSAVCFAFMLMPSYALAANDVGAVAELVIEGKLDKGEALAALTSVIEDEKSPLTVRINALSSRSAVYRMAGQPQEARTDAEKVVTLAPQKLHGYNLLAFIDMRERKFKKAAANFDKALAWCDAECRKGEWAQNAAFFRDTAHGLSGAVEAAAFFKDFENNVPEAEAKYKNKNVYLSGKIRQIDRKSDGITEILLEAGPRKNVQCRFGDDPSGYIPKLKAGQTVLVEGMLWKGGLGTVKMDCFLWDGFLDNF